MLGALPSSVRAPLENCTKETMKFRGVALYKEGSKPNGIWLISLGVVKVSAVCKILESVLCKAYLIFYLHSFLKLFLILIQWESKVLKNKHALHPTFTHGSTLGLHEVLIGKPYICDMITDSVVHCFFIDTEKILSLFKSDPAIEDFLWQVLLLLLFGHIFIIYYFLLSAYGRNKKTKLTKILWLLNLTLLSTKRDVKGWCFQVNCSANLARKDLVCCVYSI